MEKRSQSKGKLEIKLKLKSLALHKQRPTANTSRSRKPKAPSELNTPSHTRQQKPSLKQHYFSKHCNLTKQSNIVPRLKLSNLNKKLGGSQLNSTNRNNSQRKNVTCENNLVNQSNSQNNTTQFGRSIGNILQKAQTQRGKKKIDSTRITSRKTSPRQVLTKFQSDGTAVTPTYALKNFKHLLSAYEEGEILDFQQIYFISERSQKAQISTKLSNNYGIDDENGYLRIVTGDQIAYRFEILQVIGKGSFGQVLKVFDHKEKANIALKVIRNKQRFHSQAAIEVKILDLLNQNDQDGKYHIVKKTSHFQFRKHLMITFELLSINLYELISKNNFKGISINLIRRFTIQILQTLRLLKRFNIIHCDLKPENILLQDLTHSVIKVIDFGSSCFSDSKLYTYIQSRFYRAPEIILGIPYNNQIDMWSLGCILCELFTGQPIFPGGSEGEQLTCIMEVLGLPEMEYLNQSTKKRNFFDSDDNPRIFSTRGRIRHPGTKQVRRVLIGADEEFIDFIEGCLQWDASKRLTPDQGIQHVWISGVQNNWYKPQESRFLVKQFSFLDMDDAVCNQLFNELLQKMLQKRQREEFDTPQCRKRLKSYLDELEESERKEQVKRIIRHNSTQELLSAIVNDNVMPKHIKNSDFQTNRKAQVKERSRSIKNFIVKKRESIDLGQIFTELHSNVSVGENFKGNIMLESTFESNKRVLNEIPFEPNHF